MDKGINLLSAQAQAAAINAKNREIAYQYGERNFFGNRRHNIGGPGGDKGVYPLRRVGGTVYVSSIVGP